MEWALELSSFGPSMIQRRALAEFIAESTPTTDEDVLETVIPSKESPQEWIMYFDGAFSLQGAGASVLLVSPTGLLTGLRIQQSMKGSLPGSGLPQNWESRS